MSILLIVLALLAPQTQPVAAWKNTSHLGVSWPQEVSGERCISKETPGGAVYDYGCFWFFGEAGGGGRIGLPFGQEPPTAAFPSPGDIIVVNGARVVVGPHLAYLPTVAR